MVIWLIGLLEAGKTTIGRHLVRLWKQSAPNTILVDGDDVPGGAKAAGVDL